MNITVDFRKVGKGLYQYAIWRQGKKVQWSAEDTLGIILPKMMLAIEKEALK